MRREESILTVQSAFIKENNSFYYILDFDAFAANIEQNKLDSKIEELHKIILNEFHSLITEKCKEMMRGNES